MFPGNLHHAQDSDTGDEVMVSRNTNTEDRESEVVVVPGSSSINSVKLVENYGTVNDDKQYTYTADTGRETRRGEDDSDDEVVVAQSTPMSAKQHVGFASPAPNTRAAAEQRIAAMK